jgi:hypothetical protein
LALVLHEALLALPILAPRFSEIFNGHATTVPARIRDQGVGQLPDGMTGPVAD